MWASNFIGSCLHLQASSLANLSDMQQFFLAQDAGNNGDGCTVQAKVFYANKETAVNEILLCHY